MGDQSIPSYAFNPLAVLTLSGISMFRYYLLSIKVKHTTVQ
jgi:hypothetical protein